MAESIFQKYHAYLHVAQGQNVVYTGVAVLFE